jgi:hypothetical protein
MAASEIISENARTLYMKTFAVDGTGTAAITAGGELGTLVDNGTGDYTLTFTEPFAASPLTYAVTPVADSGTISFRIHSDTNNTKVRVVFSADTKFTISIFAVKDPQ